MSYKILSFYFYYFFIPNITDVTCIFYFFFNISFSYSVKENILIAVIKYNIFFIIFFSLCFLYYIIFLQFNLFNLSTFYSNIQYCLHCCILCLNLYLFNTDIIRTSIKSRGIPPSFIIFLLIILILYFFCSNQLSHIS